MVLTCSLPYIAHKDIADRNNAETRLLTAVDEFFSKIIRPILKITIKLICERQVLLAFSL
jgi:hypothetical protein